MLQVLDNILNNVAQQSTQGAGVAKSGIRVNGLVGALSTSQSATNPENAVQTASLSPFAGLLQSTQEKPIPENIQSLGIEELQNALQQLEAKLTTESETNIDSALLSQLKALIENFLKEQTSFNLDSLEDLEADELIAFLSSEQENGNSFTKAENAENTNDFVASILQTLQELAQPLPPEKKEELTQKIFTLLESETPQKASQKPINHIAFSEGTSSPQASQQASQTEEPQATATQKTTPDTLHTGQNKPAEGLFNNTSKETVQHQHQTQVQVQVQKAENANNFVISQENVQKGSSQTKQEQKAPTQTSQPIVKVQHQGTEALKTVSNEASPFAAIQDLDVDNVTITVHKETPNNTKNIELEQIALNDVTNSAEEMTHEEPKNTLLGGTSEDLRIDSDEEIPTEEVNQIKVVQENVERVDIEVLEEVNEITTQNTIQTYGAQAQQDAQNADGLEADVEEIVGRKIERTETSNANQKERANLSSNNQQQNLQQDAQNRDSDTFLKSYTPGKMTFGQQDAVLSNHTLKNFATFLESMEVTPSSFQPTQTTATSALSSTVANTAFTGTARGFSYPTPTEQIALKIQKAFEGNADKISIKLDPANLGKVDIQFEVAKNGTVKANISASEPETLRLLKQDTTGLIQAFQNAGLEAEDQNLNFSMNQNQQDPEGHKKGLAEHANNKNLEETSFEELVEDMSHLSPTELAYSALAHKINTRINMVV